MAKRINKKINKKICMNNIIYKYIMTNLEKFLIVFVVVIFLTVAVVLTIFFTNNQKTVNDINFLQEQQIFGLETELDKLKTRFDTDGPFVDINGIEYPLSYFKGRKQLLKNIAFPYGRRPYIGRNGRRHHRNHEDGGEEGFESYLP